MARITCSAFLLICCIQCVSVVVVQSRLVPAMYVFGDSLADDGNNLFLEEPKSNYKPYAVDYPNGTFGRFTNAYTLAEHLAFKLNLPMQLPIKDPRSKTTNCTDGFNYASSTAGILEDTGSSVSESTLNLAEQVELFKKTAQEFLPKHLKDEKAIKRHIGKSIFFIQIGANDYAMNYINNEKNMQAYTPQHFADYLVAELSRQIEELYDMGARRFVVAEVGLLGCLPIATKFVPNNNAKSGCVEELNGLANFFNSKLADKLEEFDNTLLDAGFVIIKSNFLGDLVTKPQSFGFKDATNTCCKVDATASVFCVPNEPPCEDRKELVFFDAVHPTDAVNKLIAKQCFDGEGVCIPSNVKQFLKQNKYIERKTDDLQENLISFPPTSAPAPAPGPAMELEF